MSQEKKFAHFSDVVHGVVRQMRHPPKGASGQTASEPPTQSPQKKRTDELPLDLDSAPQRPAASAPSRLGNSVGGWAGEKIQPPDFQRDTCWVGNVRLADASEEKLKAIFVKLCGRVRSIVVRQKPDRCESGGPTTGKSWAFVTFLTPELRDRAVAAGSLPGTGGYPIRVELPRLDKAFSSDGELHSLWERAKDKAHETTGWATQLASPQSKKRRRHSTPGTLGDHALAGAEVEPAGAAEMARALKEAGNIDDISEVIKETFLAKGTSGAVFRAQWNGMNVAAKYFTMMDDPKVMEAFQQELEVMRSLQHTNLLRVYGYCMNPSSPCLVTELMYGSLDQLLWGSQSSIAPKLRERQQLKIMDGIAAGIAFLHKNGICHRDLKSPNVLYNRDLTMKLCDFAFSKWKRAGAEQVMSSAVGTPAWMAPEILRGGEYDFKADVYSFGVILWEVLARKQPFKELNAFAISYQVGTQGRLLPMAEIEDTAAAISGPDSGVPAAESSCAQEPSHDSSVTSGTVSSTWWKTLLQDCFREACDRPTLDQIVATLHHAKARPPEPPRMAAQGSAAQQHMISTSSGTPAANSHSEQAATTATKTGAATIVTKTGP